MINENRISQIDNQSVVIAKLHKEDVAVFEKLIEIFNDVFETNRNIPSRAHLSAVLANPDFLAFTVSLDGVTIGGLTIYVLTSYYEAHSVAYIYDIGMLKQFQRKGFGKKLLAFVFQYCKSQHISQAFVQAETEDEDAVAFYHRTNASDYLQATHFTYNL